MRSLLLVFLFICTHGHAALQFSERPLDQAVVPRNPALNTAEVALSGNVISNGYEDVILRVYRDDVEMSETVQPLVYTGNTAPFGFNPVIVAETANYDFEFVLRTAAVEQVVTRIEDVVAGDIYVIQGQSNAEAVRYNGSANGNQSPFLRSFGINSDNAAGIQSDSAWHMAEGDRSRNAVVGNVGQWGLRLGRRLIDQHGVPVAILNGGHGGTAIGFFQRNDANHLDLNTNYGRLHHRISEAGLTPAIRAILFYQGESDGGNAAVHESGFTALYDDWRDNYPGLDQIYVVQLRVGCGVSKNNVALREVQRRFQDSLPDVTVMSTTGLNAHDGCHYAFVNGYEQLGDRLAPLLGRDLFGAPDLPGLEAPNVSHAFWSDASGTELTVITRRADDELIMDAGAAGDFLIEGIPVSVSGGVASGRRLVLQLSGNGLAADGLSYTGHSGSGPWVSNQADIGLLTFSTLPIQTISTLPAAPMQLMASTSITTRVALTWDDVTNAVSYVVFRDDVEIGTSVLPTFHDYGFTGQTNHAYTVSAVNPIGMALSAALAVQTPVPPPPPEAPTNIFASGVSYYRIDLHWDVAPSVEAYAVRRDGVWQGNTTLPPFVDNGLFASTVYGYEVAAVSGNVTSDYSAVLVTTAGVARVYEQVPEAAGYDIVYDLPIPDVGNFRNGTPVPYAVDLSSSYTSSFNRIAYYLELADGVSTQWVFTAMDAFSLRVGEIGLPHHQDNPVIFQQEIQNLLVRSSAGANVTTGEFANTGNIEFWPSNYSQGNEAGVSNASDAVYDFGDGGASTGAGYGSFQVHNHDIDGPGGNSMGETLFAYNRWGGTGISDLGIGNRPGQANSDWTFAGNAARYTMRTLHILVRSDPDSDGDGLADAWERQFFGGLHPLSEDDPDKDGLTNSQEEVAGTHPDESESVPRLTIDRASGMVSASIFGVSGRRYQLQTTRDLVAPVWGNQASAMAGNDDTLLWQLSPPLLHGATQLRVEITRD